MNLPANRAPADFWKTAGICALLGVLVFAVFGQTARHDYVNYDDYYYTYRNPEVMRGLTFDGVLHAFTEKTGGLRTPLVVLSHIVDSQFYGEWAGGRHMTNVLLHAASAILLFLVLHRMTGALWRSAFVAALFAAHPLQVESVAWISERKDTLSGLFFMLTLWAYARYARDPSKWRYAWVAILLACGLMCKVMLVSVPAVLLLLDYWPLGRFGGGNWKRLALEKIPLALLSVAAGGTALAERMLHSGKDDMSGIEMIPLRERLMEAPAWVITYLRQMAWPAELSVVYTHPERVLAWWWIATLMVTAVTTACWVLRRRFPYLWTGWMWNVVMLGPVIGILQISRHEQADHYNYLPQTGVYMALTWLATEWAGARHNRRVALGWTAGAIVCALATAAFVQASYWQDSRTLWTHALTCTRDNYIALNDLGDIANQQGKTLEAIADFEGAVKINPDYDLAHYNLGVAFNAVGEQQKAIEQYREAIRINPNYGEARFNLGNSLRALGRTDEALEQWQEAVKEHPDYTSARVNLANALLEKGRTDEALEQSRAAVRMDPNASDVRVNYGNALLREGRVDEAAEQWREALRLNPLSAEAHHNLGNLLVQQGRVEEAATHFQEALNLRPDSVIFQNEMALLLATAPKVSMRNGARALDLATKANNATGGKNPLVLRTLAAAYAEMKDFPKAVGTAKDALEMAQAEKNAVLADALQGDLKMYEAGRK